MSRNEPLMAEVNGSFHGNWTLHCALDLISVDHPPVVLLLPRIVAVNTVE